MLDFNRFIKSRQFKDFSSKLERFSKPFDTKDLGEGIYKITINPEADRTICIVGGIHGDEPAGSCAILKFLEQRVYVPKNKKVVFIPVANPTGFELGTRENENKVDINRGFFENEMIPECKSIWDGIKNEKIDLLHTLHETPDDFYLYYTSHEELAKDIRDAARKYFNIMDGEVEGDKVYEGLVPLPHVVKETLEDKVFQYSCPYIATETPVKESLVKRVDFNLKMIRMAINYF